MILSNTAIWKALDDGRLKLTPEPIPRTPSADEEFPYATSSVDLKLGHNITILKSGIPVDINLTVGKFANFFGSNSDTITLAANRPYILEPNKFVLGQTLEVIGFDVDAGKPCLAGRFEGRSSFARFGLLVHFTAPTIHAGFTGPIVLELANLGPCNIALYSEMVIGQLIVEEVLDKPIKNDSQFQGQKGPGGNP